jgi:hypothetical protein
MPKTRDQAASPKPAALDKKRKELLIKIRAMLESAYDLKQSRQYHHHTINSDFFNALAQLYDEMKEVT